jgi:hypothetical protein
MIGSEDPLMNKKWLNKKYQQLILNSGVGSNLQSSHNDDKFP